MNRGLSVALKDRNPDVRKNAIRDITLFYDLVLQISQSLQHAVDDTDEEVRQAATWAVSQLTRFQGRADLESRSALPSWSHPPQAPEDIP
jgi:HEAT repeat protein